MPLIQASLAPSTWQAHGKAWEEWVSFTGAGWVPASSAALCAETENFLLFLRDQGVSWAVVQKRLAGLAFHFKLKGWPDATKKFSIRQALKGWRRQTPQLDSRRPVSFQLLLSLVRVTPEICRNSFESLLLALSFSLCFFGAFRISELLSPSGVKLGGFSRDDYILGPDFLRLRIQKSKTDVLGKGIWVLLKEICCPACPVSLMRQYLCISLKGSALLSHQDGSPFTRYQFTILFKRSLTRLGHNPVDYGTHSFRIGAATQAAKAGLPESDVQKIGRWRSACFARYVRPDLVV